MESKRFTQTNITFEDLSVVNALSKRDRRPMWLVIKDALSYYEKIHQKPRPTPAPGTVPRRGRPRKVP